MTYYKFVQWDAAPVEEMTQYPIYRALAEYDNGNIKPLRNLHLVLDNPHIDRGGWRFILTPYFKRYWVKLRGYGINEYYAMNKTDIRDRFKSYVIEIIEIKSKEF